MPVLYLAAIRAALFAVWVATAARPAAAAETIVDPAQVAYRSGAFADALGLWRIAAAKGDAAAQCGLGMLYDLGQGVKQDPQAAFGWYLKSAAQGYPEAEFSLGVMNDSGDGRPFNAVAAAAWYGRAAAHHYAAAAYILGQLYEAGQGVPRNRDMAEAWYEASALQYPASSRRLAVLRASPWRPQQSGRGLVAPVAADGPMPEETDRAPKALVWLAPAEPKVVTFLVTILAVDGAAMRPSFSVFTNQSAIAMPPLRPGAYLWRVYAVDSAGGHYAASAWRHLEL